MARNYIDLLTRVRAAHRFASEDFHSDATRQNISEATDGLEEPLRAATSASGAEAENILRQLDYQLTVLTTALERAKRDGERTVARAALLDRAARHRRASIQYGADAALLAQVRTLIGQVREDLQGQRPVAPRDRPDIRPEDPAIDTPIKIEPFDLRALRHEIKRRASEKEDPLFAAELAQISGERTEPGRD